MKTHLQISTHDNPYTKSHPRDAWEYARQALAGEIIACRYVKLACKRFIEDAKNPDLFFNESAAQRVCNFYEALPHVKDYWASTSQKFKMEPWQKFTECNIFGWYWTGTEKRRFKEAYEEIARKNGKSFKMGARGSYTFCADGVFGAEVYSGATTEKQAWEVFGPIRQIFKRTPMLAQHYNVEVNAKNLNILTTGSKCEPVIGDPGDGSSPSHAIADEYHEHQSDSLVQTMVTGMGARAMHGSPLMSYITTAGADTGGPCYEKRAEVIKILEGTVKDETVFGIIFTADEDDDWQDEISLIKANPNYDVSVDSGWLKQELEKAKRSATKQVAYKTKHLNMWVGAKAAWMNMLAFQACRKKKLNIEDFKGRRCYVAVDLASKVDIASMAILFPPENGGKFAAFVKHYLPEDTIQEKDRYRAWNIDGWIEATPGNVIDYEYIEDDLKKLKSNHEIIEVPYDPFQATQFSVRMIQEGFPMIELGATVKNFSEPMKELEALILKKDIDFEMDPVLMWMFGNVVAKMDQKDNIYPNKERNENKIDGVVALIMTINRTMLYKAPNPSIYQTQSL